jgi:SAM-dependent methyltransferase
MDTALDRLRTEFDRWARDGRGESMAVAHRPVTDAIIESMNLGPDSRVLDLGCGTGWATRLVAERVPEGLAVGLDVSEEMIQRARGFGNELPNVQFKVLRESRFPFHDGIFSHCLSIESLYYHPDITASLGEVHRVLAPGGAAFLMVNLFRENPYTHRWVELIGMPVHLLGADEYCAHAREAGFPRVEHRMIPDPTPVPDDYHGRHYESPEALRASRAIGSLLVIARKL